nr:hypothetical protein [Tanacetum cinerariifolium]
MGLSQAIELALIIDETSKGITKAVNSTGGDSSRPPAMVAEGHRCPEKALQLLLVDDEDEEEDKEGVMTRNTLHLEEKLLDVEKFATLKRNSQAPCVSYNWKWPNDFYLRSLYRDLGNLSAWITTILQWMLGWKLLQSSCVKSAVKGYPQDHKEVFVLVVEYQPNDAGSVGSVYCPAGEDGYNWVINMRSGIGNVVMVGCIFGKLFAYE